MAGHEPCAKLGRFSLGTLCSSHARVRALDSSITPLFRGARFYGVARTVRTPPGQNAAIHRAVHAAKSGDVLMVDGGGCCSFGLFGDILATACARRGVAGCVIDGTIRDTEALRNMRFPVFSRGINPLSAGKSDPGQVDTEIVCGGVHIRPGDCVIADEDGVVVVPRDIGPQIALVAEALARSEEDIKERLAAGETTCEIFGITP